MNKCLILSSNNSTLLLQTITNDNSHFRQTNKSLASPVVATSSLNQSYTNVGQISPTNHSMKAKPYRSPSANSLNISMSKESNPSPSPRGSQQHFGK